MKNQNQLGAIPPQVIAGMVQAGGNIVGNIGAPDSVKWGFPQCGKKPLFGFTKKAENWRNCVQTEIDKNRSVAMIQRKNSLQPQNESFVAKNKNWLIPVSVGVVGFILYKTLN